MATIRRIEVVWAGITGLPGLSVFYSGSAVDVTTELNAFFTTIKDLFPGGTTWNIPGSGDTIDDATGTLNGGWSGGTNVSVISTAGAANYAAGVGAFVKWSTNAIVNGRRLKGRTFLTSLKSDQYDTGGTLQSSTLTTIGGAAATLAAAGKLLIWHRPPPGGSSGQSSLVTSQFLPDKVTSLRSRRN